MEVTRDGWTDGLQMSISQLDENGTGHRYRIAGRSSTARARCCSSGSWMSGTRRRSAPTSTPCSRNFPRAPPPSGRYGWPTRIAATPTSRCPGEEKVFAQAPAWRRGGWAEVAVVSRRVTPWTEAPEPAEDEPVTCRHCGEPISPCPHLPAFYPVCKGWRHEGYKSQPIGAHYCGGRSINPSAEPREDEDRD